MERWPLYVFEIIFGLMAMTLTLWVWRRRGSGWSENLIILPWLAGTVAFGVYLILQVIALGWHDIPALGRNATISGALAVAGPVSVVLVMVMRLLKIQR
jgi:hypothetical protein